MSMLRKKEFVTIVTPIPGFIPRQLAIDILHSHSEVITLNPLVLDHKAIKSPRDAASDEYYSTWYEIIERIQYIPGLGKMGSGKIAFKGCFHNMPWGLQAHIYAPMNTDLRYKYKIAGNQPGVEPPEQMEMGLMALGAPSDGLYLREDVEVKCSIAVMSFVKSQLKAASKLMVERIIKKAELVDAGVLHAMIENGKLKTVNPADRSSSVGASVAAATAAAAGHISPSATPSPGQQQLHQDSKLEHRQTISRPPSLMNSSPNLSSSMPQTMPYHPSRPQSYSPAAYSQRPGSASIPQGYGSMASPTTSQTPYMAYPSYSAHPGHISYSGHPSYTSPYMHPAASTHYGHPQVAEMQGYPSMPMHMASSFTHVESGGNVRLPPPPLAPPPPQFAVEMPGDYYHTQNAQFLAAAPAPLQPHPPQSSVYSTPRSNHDSDILSTGKWSVPTEYTQATSLSSPPGSRPTSINSEQSGSGGANGYRSPGLDKHFSSDLSTHAETQEEHRAQTLKMLEQPAGASLNSATYRPSA